MKKKKITEELVVAEMDRLDSVFIRTQSGLNWITQLSLLGRISNRISSLSGIFTGENAHSVCDQGLTLILINSPIDFPSVNGTLLNIQRLGRNNVTTSQYITQILAGNNGLYYRLGRGDGSIVVYGTWAKIA